MVVDTTAPQVNLTFPGDVKHFLTETPKFHVSVKNPWADKSITSTEPPISFAIDVDWNHDGDFDDVVSDYKERDWMVGYAAQSNLTYTLPEMPGGRWTIQARSKDDAGNVGIHKATINIAMDIGEHGEHGGSSSVAYSNSAPRAPLPGRGPVADLSSPTSPAAIVLADVNASEVEPNDTAATANIVTLPSTGALIVSGGISTAADVDYYRFTLAARSGVFFDIDSRETGLSTTLNSVLDLLDAAGTTIDSNDNGFDFDTGLPAQNAQPTTTSADSALYADLAPGTYLIAVSSAGNTTGNYQLRITADSSYTNAPPALNSNPTAAATIYLDFDGHSSSSDAWATSNGACLHGSTIRPRWHPVDVLAWRAVSHHQPLAGSLGRLRRRSTLTFRPTTRAPSPMALPCVRSSPTATPRSLGYRLTSWV